MKRLLLLTILIPLTAACEPVWVTTDQPYPISTCFTGTFTFRSKSVGYKGEGSYAFKIYVPTDQLTPIDCSEVQ